MPVMRCLWPGVNENAKRSSAMVANMRKRAAQASRFMLQMIKAPMYGDKGAPTGEDETESSTNSSADFSSGEEGLAILIAAEVIIIRCLRSLFCSNSFCLDFEMLGTHIL